MKLAMKNAVNIPTTRAQILLWIVLTTPFLLLGGALYAYIFLSKSYAWAPLAALLPAGTTFAVTRLLRITHRRFALTAGPVAVLLVLATGYLGAWHINQTNLAWRVSQHHPLTLPTPIDEITLRNRVIGNYFATPHAEGNPWDHIVAIANHGRLSGIMPPGWPPLPLAERPNRQGTAAWTVWLFQAGVYSLLIIVGIQAAGILSALTSAPSPSRGSLFKPDNIFGEYGVTHPLTPDITPLRPWFVLRDFSTGWYSYSKVIVAMVAFAALYHAPWEAFALWLLFAGALLRASFFIFYPRESSTLGTPLDRLLNQLAQQVRVGVLLLTTLALVLWVYRHVDVNALARMELTANAAFATAALIIPWLLVRLWPAYLIPLLYRGQGTADLWSQPADSKDAPSTSKLAILSVKLAWQLTATPGALMRATLPVIVTTTVLFTLLVQLESIFDRLPGMNTFASFFTTMLALPFLHFLILERALALRNACPRATASAIRATGKYFANDPYAPSTGEHPLSWLSAVFLPLRLWPARWRRSDHALHQARLQAHNDLARGARKRAGHDPTRLLQDAARIGNRRLIEEAMARGAIINSHDVQGRSPLICALQMRKLPVILLLLEHGADPNFVDSTGRPPLFFALESQESSAVAQLINHGANPEQRDTELNTCWHIAVRLGKVNLCELLLNISHLINAPNQNGTIPIHLVCNENDDVEMFEWLVAHGANVAVPVPPNGESLASVAARLNRPGMLRLLAHLGHPIDEIDGSRRTPLIHAVTQENSAAVAMLLHLGADVHKMTFSGSALELAEQQLAVQHTAKRETIVDMLREHSVIV